MQNKIKNKNILGSTQKENGSQAKPSDQKGFAGDNFVSFS